MKIRISSTARRDLVDGYRFYEAQVEGIGAYFLNSLYSDIETLSVNAGVHSRHFGRYHRLLARRFPFAVYYRVVNETVLVYAVLDCRRKPAWIRSRLGAQ